ncbi:MAG: hypothetical protein ACLQU2_12695 [Candidatus Binataceae bacterium]
MIYSLQEQHGVLIGQGSRGLGATRNSLLIRSKDWWVRSAFHYERGKLEKVNSCPPASSSELTTTLQRSRHYYKLTGKNHLSLDRTVKPGSCWIIQTSNVESPFFGRIR